MPILYIVNIFCPRPEGEIKRRREKKTNYDATLKRHKTSQN